MNNNFVNQQADKEFKVCLLGASLDVGNLGCRALAASFVKLILDMKPNARISLLYGNRTNGVQNLKISGKTIELEIVNFRLSPKAKLSEHLLWIFLLALIQKILPIKCIRNKILRTNRWLKTLSEADFVGEIRGGDSFSDIYGFRKFILGVLPCVIVILTGKNLVLLPQTYGPFKSRIARSIARFIILRSHKIFSRDKESMNLVREILGQKGRDKSVKFCPDMAFTLEAILPEKPFVKPKLDRNNSSPLIGLNISGLLYVGGFTRDNMFGLKVDYKDFISEVITWLMENTCSHVILVPHVYWNDQEGDEMYICENIRASMDKGYQNRIHLVTQECDQNEIKGIIGMCDFFIGARMHSCIAALSQNIPTVGLAYSKKFAGVFESIGVGNYVADMRQLKQDELINIINKIYENREIERKKLQPMIAEAREKITAAFKEIINQE